VGETTAGGDGVGRTAGAAAGGDAEGGDGGGSEGGFGGGVVGIVGLTAGGAGEDDVTCRASGTAGGASCSGNSSTEPSTI
jgi:hypothetical protein